MQTVLLNKEKYRVPTCWEEVTVKQYVQIVRDWDPDFDIADRDYFKLLKILTGVDFVGMDETSENQVSLMSILGWVIMQPFSFSKKLPKVVSINGKVIDIPEDPGELSIGQNIHLRRDYLDRAKVLEECISIAAAIFLQPAYTETKFHINKAKELSQEIDKMPIGMIYPIGFFLLQRCMNFGNPSVRIWNRIKISLKQMLKKMSPTWPK
jgi:hypothetical protein